MHAMRKLHDLRNDGAFGPWVAAITRTFAARFHRRHRPTLALSGAVLDGRPVSGTAGGGGGATRAEALRVLAVLHRLPETYRETLVLRLVEGLTGPQIAASTGLTPGSVRVNLHRGMTLLRAQLGRDESAEDRS